MKPKNFNFKLLLKKQTIAHLNSAELQSVKGGEYTDDIRQTTCNPKCGTLESFCVACEPDTWNCVSEVVTLCYSYVYLC